MSTGLPPVTPHQKLTVNYLARQLPIFEERVPKSSQQPSFKFPTNSPDNLPAPPLLPGEAIHLQQHRIVCTDCFQEPAVGAIYITNYRLIFNGNYISDPDSLDALQEIQYHPKKDSSSGEVSAHRGSRSTLLRLIGKGSQEPSFNSYVMSPEQKVAESAPSLSSRLQQGFRQKLGSLRRSPKRTTSDSSTATVTSFTYASSKGQGEDCEDGGGAKRKRKALFLNPDTVSLDSMSVSSLSEFSECPTTGTDETPDRGVSSPLAEIANESLLEPVDYFDGRPQDAESVFISIPDSPSQPPPLSIGSCGTVDSGINMPESVQSSVFTSLGSFTAEQLPALTLLPGPGCGKAGGCSRVPKPNQNGLAPTEEPDFEKSLELDGDSVLEQERRELKLRGSWYRKKSAVCTLESDSEDDTGPNHSAGDLYPDACAENLPTGYSKIAILGSIKKKPATDSSPPVQSSELHITDSAEDVSRLDRADTITNSNAQAEDSVQVSDPLAMEDSPVLPHGHRPMDTHSNTASSSGRDATETPPVSSTDLTEQSDATNHEPAWLQYSSIVIGDPQIPKPTTKQRSFSSPRIKKKPKPLPRKFQRKLRSLDNLDDARSRSREATFLSNQPPTFKPTPAPRGSQEQVPQRTEEEERKEQDLVSSLPADFLLTPAAQDADSPRITATQDDDHAEIITKPKSVSSPPVPPPKASPVPPPRTKRKSKFRKMSQESSSSNSASSLTNSPIREAASHGGASRSQSDVTDVVIESPDGGPSSHDSASPDLPKESHDSSEGGSPDLTKGSSNECISPDLADPLQRNPLWRHSISNYLEQPLLTLPGEGEEESRLSKVSMEVNRGSYRPLSVQLSPLDSSSLSPLAAEKDGRGFVVSHNGVVTWSPRSRRSQKGYSPLPASTRYTLSVALPLAAIHSVKKIQSVVLKEQAIKLPEGLLILGHNFHSMKLHVHPHNTYDTDGLRELLGRHFLAAKPIFQSFAFAHRAAIRHPNPTFLNSTSLPNFMHLSDELERLGLQNSKLWRVTKLLQDHPDICPSYPAHLVVPIVTPDLDIIRGALLYREGRFPTLCWADRESGAALLRAAITNAKRGQASSHLEVDEALLNSICGCNQNARGNNKLFIFTEKTKAESSGFSADPMHTNLTAEEVRTYYYRNCKFIYTVNPPTFKGVRHSFNKLQAMLENKLPDEDYLIALDVTHWLPRVGELLATASSVCHTLREEAAHVLVSYESGWDRTAQIVSLAQLLLDPYYRTMDGFQVLVQKEWLWFGHPFSSRHTRRGKVKEDGPIFLQWIDCVWQVMHQCPSAFEFNQRFLMMLVEYSYSCRFGSFMMNSEKERKERFYEEGHKHMSVFSHTASLWTWISMVNAAGRTFYSQLYDPLTHSGVIYPRTALPCLKLWTSHYCRYKTQEDVTTTSTLQRQLTELVHLYKRMNVDGEHSLEVTSPVVTKAMSTSPPPALADESQEWKRHNHSPMLERQGGRPAVAKQISNRSTKLIQQFTSIELYLVSQGIDPTICKNIEMSQKICQGYMIKLGAVRKNWRKRWFVLDFNCQYLAYFESQDAYINKERPKGVIQLNELQNVYQSTKRREHLVKHIFTVETPIRTYYFQAPTILTMELWMACLRVPVSSLQANTQ